MASVSYIAFQMVFPADTSKTLSKAPWRAVFVESTIIFLLILCVMGLVLFSFDVKLWFSGLSSFLLSFMFFFESFLDRHAHQSVAAVPLLCIFAICWKTAKNPFRLVRSTFVTTCSCHKGSRYRSLLWLSVMIGLSVSSAPPSGVPLTAARRLPLQSFNPDERASPKSSTQHFFAAAAAAEEDIDAQAFTDVVPSSAASPIRGSEAFQKFKAEENQGRLRNRQEMERWMERQLATFRALQLALPGYTSEIHKVIKEKLFAKRFSEVELEIQPFIGAFSPVCYLSFIRCQKDPERHHKLPASDGSSPPAKIFFNDIIHEVIVESYCGEIHLDFLPQTVRSLTVKNSVFLGTPLQLGDIPVGVEYFLSEDTLWGAQHVPLESSSYPDSDAHSTATPNCSWSSVRSTAGSTTVFVTAPHVRGWTELPDHEPLGLLSLASQLHHVKVTGPLFSGLEVKDVPFRSEERAHSATTEKTVQMTNTSVTAFWSRYPVLVSLDLNFDPLREREGEGGWRLLSTAPDRQGAVLRKAASPRTVRDNDHSVVLSPSSFPSPESTRKSTTTTTSSSTPQRRDIVPRRSAVEKARKKRWNLIRERARSSNPVGSSDALGLPISFPPTLLHLRLDSVYVPEWDVIVDRILQKAPSLTSLKLLHCGLHFSLRVVQQSVRQLAQQLEVVELTGNTCIEESPNEEDRNLALDKVTETSNENLSTLGLSALYLEDCDITDAALPLLYGWNGLKELDLTNNRLRHFDFEQLPSSVTALSLRGNHLSGPLPMGRLPRQLEALDLSDNAFSGTLSVRDLPPRMEDLDVSENHFSGEVMFGDMPEAMVRMDLHGNGFQGWPELTDLPLGLRSLWIYDNNWTWYLPSL